MEVLFRTSDAGRYPGFRAVVTCFTLDSAEPANECGTNPPIGRRRRNAEVIITIIIYNYN